MLYIKESDNDISGNQITIHVKESDNDSCQEIR